MTDLWETLWGFWDAGKVDPFALKTCFPDFIKKIRAEGDKLKEKANRYDTGERVWVPRGYFSESKIKDDDVLMLILEGETLQNIGDTPT